MKGRDIELDRFVRESSILVVDQLVSEFVNEARSASSPFWLVKHAVLGLQARHRFLRFGLPRAWDCIRSWQARRRFSNRIPMSFEFLQY